MTCASPEPRKLEGATPGYGVEPPRSSDAIGLALRDAYDERSSDLPDDMSAMLRRLYNYEAPTRR